MNLVKTRLEKLLIKKTDDNDIIDDFNTLILNFTKNYTSDVNKLSDGSLITLAWLFHIGNRQIEELHLGIMGKRAMINSATALVRRGYCYWDVPTSSNSHLGNILCIDNEHI